MSVLTISTYNYQPEVRENLFNEINFLCREGIKVKLEEKSAGKFIFLDCSIAEIENEEQKHSHEKILRYYLANIITDYLMNQLTKVFINKILKSRYRCFDEAELHKIMDNAFYFLHNLQEESETGENILRHNRVFNEVSRYLANNTLLYLEGFFRFRLKDYFQELVESTEKAVDGYLVEQEYQEFIQLLRYFVEIQQPKLDEVHVLIQSKDEVYFLDEVSQPIRPEQIHGERLGLDEEIEYDDWLLSALITIAPRRIILHLAAESEMAKTIISVFTDRIEICKGCALCGKNFNPSISKLHNVKRR